MRRRSGLLDVRLQRWEGLNGRDRDHTDRRSRDAGSRGEAANGHRLRPGCLSHGEGGTEPDRREDPARAEPPPPDLACPPPPKWPKTHNFQNLPNLPTLPHISPISLKVVFYSQASYAGTR